MFNNIYSNYILIYCLIIDKLTNIKWKIFKLVRGKDMKNKRGVIAILLFIGIVVFGLIRMSIINKIEIARGTPTMTGEFAFIAYLVTSILITVIWMIISIINSINEEIFNRGIKNIFIGTLLIIFLPIILGILMIFG